MRSIMRLHSEKSSQLLLFGRKLTRSCAATASSFASLSSLDLLQQREAVWLHAKQQRLGYGTKLSPNPVSLPIATCEAPGRLSNLRISRYKLRDKTSILQASYED